MTAPDLPPGPYYAIDYHSVALPDGSTRMTRNAHFIDRNGEKDEYTDVWIEPASGLTTEASSPIPTTG